MEYIGPARGPFFLPLLYKYLPLIYSIIKAFKYLDSIYIIPNSIHWYSWLIALYSPLKIFKRDLKRKKKGIISIIDTYSCCCLIHIKWFKASLIMCCLYVYVTPWRTVESEKKERERDTIVYLYRMIVSLIR